MKPAVGYLALKTASATPIVHYQTDFTFSEGFKIEEDNTGIYLKSRNYLGLYSNGVWNGVEMGQPQSSVFMTYSHRNNIEVAIATVFNGGNGDSVLRQNLELIESVAKDFFLTRKELSSFFPVGVTEPTWEEVCNARKKMAEHYDFRSPHTQVWIKIMTVEEAKKLLQAMKCEIILPH